MSPSSIWDLESTNLFYLYKRETSLLKPHVFFFSRPTHFLLCEDQSCYKQMIKPFITTPFETKKQPTCYNVPFYLLQV